MMDLNRRLRRKTDYRLEAMDGELLLYHPGETKALYCNQTASLVWQLCDGARTAAEIIALLAEAYPEARDEIATQVQETLQEFQAHGVIEQDA